MWMNFFSLHKYRTRTKIVWAASVSIGIPVLWLLLTHFGVELVFVIAPVAVIAALAYRIHLDRLEQITKEISEASRIHLATVEALATAIDARDQIGKGHVRRTQIYAVGLGQVLGLSESDINALRTGALLHDIGKLAIPDHILSKPGSLTPAEMEKTKTHSAVGASILEEVGFHYPVVPTVRHHHESWDGTGYPDRLKKEDIPLTARILAVADAFDTMRAARPYRLAMERGMARQTIQDEAGSRFDPAIVSTLLQHLAAFEAEIDAAGLSYDDPRSPQRGMEGHNYVDQIKLANREVFSLYELAREFGSAVDLQDTLSMFAKKIEEFVPFDTCGLYLLDETNKFAAAAHVGGLNAELLADRRIKIGQGATGFALKTRETVQNVNPDLDFAYSQSELAGQYSAMASVPMIADDKLIGAVTIYSRELDGYGEENIRLLETISRIAADAIGKSLTHNEAKAHALTDPLTGLPNARCLHIQFEKEVGRASRGDSGFQLLMLDLDGFKAVNDTYGHKVGDEMLVKIGKVIGEQLRDYDFLARYGGDEFVALIPETNPVGVVELCTRIEKAVSDFSIQVGDNKFTSVGVSLGASGYPRNGETFDELIVAADKAMYDRKSSRKRFALTHNADLLNKTSGSPMESKGPSTRPPDNPNDDPLRDSLIVELDETHVITSSAVN